MITFSAESARISDNLGYCWRNEMIKWEQFTNWLILNHEIKHSEGQKWIKEYFKVLYEVIQMNLLSLICQQQCIMKMGQFCWFCRCAELDTTGYWLVLLTHGCYKVNLEPPRVKLIQHDDFISSFFILDTPTLSVNEKLRRLLLIKSQPVSS